MRVAMYEAVLEGTLVESQEVIALIRPRMACP